MPKTLERATNGKPNNGHPPAAYQALLKNIDRLTNTIQQSVLRYYWQLGKYIVEVEQRGDVRAAYGDALIPRLSADLMRKYGAGWGFSESNLSDSRLFYLNNKILRTSGELTWSHYVRLMRVKDLRQRKQLERRAIAGHLGERDLHRLIKAERSETEDAEIVESKLPPLKRPGNLKLGTYRKYISKLDTRHSTLDTSLLEESNWLLKCPVSSVQCLDLGFFIVLPVTKDQVSLVTVTDTPSYTYAAKVERVIDGDTLLVVIHAGFGIFVYEKLRLRGINTPELGTPDGEKAKKYVANLLPPGSTIVLKSHKSGIDKYGRFVVDVFYRKNCDEPSLIASEGVYLNQQLLDEGFAERMAD